MKTKNISINIPDSAKRKVLTIMVLLISACLIWAQGTHPGTDEGLPTPIDGGILMALLAGGGIITMLLKKKKSKSKE